MAEKNELMTIKVFAAASGRSQQAIYKQISTRLSAYLHEVDGQKFIERRALFEVFGIGEEVEQCNFNTTNRKKDSSDKVIALLEQTIEMLKEDLQEKNKQIADLTEANKELAKSVGGAQALHAGTMKQMLPEGDPAEVSETVIAAVQEEVGSKPNPEPLEAKSRLQEALKGLTFGERIRLLFGGERK